MSHREGESGPFPSHRTARYHHLWTDLVRDEPPETATESPLLELSRSSDVNPLLPEQIAQARRVLKLRSTPADGADDSADDYKADLIREGQRRIVERFLAGRRAHYGEEQSRPLDDARALAAEGRDVFIVVKFMDEAPHLAATLHSLLNQQDFDLGRLVVLAVDNNSTDGSGEIVRAAIRDNRSAARLIYLNQSRPGAGNAARLGVDTCIATVYAMCESDGRWERLQHATVAVSDGDTVYHARTLRSISDILEQNPTVDGVMPFLTYKFTAALRLFHDYVPAFPDVLADRAAGVEPTPVAVDLATGRAHDGFPRWLRHAEDGGVALTDRAGSAVHVPLTCVDEHGRGFGVIADPAGRVGYVFGDRTLVPAEAPVSGYDAALVFLENGGVRPEEKWRWHTVIGHDLFLLWAFAGMGLPEGMIFPDTSDALKTMRLWAIAIGGQHQLRRPGLRIATGSDYQSGRVLQAVGCTVRLGPAEVFAETETDRLIKMIRNFQHRQSVFYGQTRGEPLERATGLYVHMTRIQDDIEREMRGYDDTMFERTAFPERVLFPLRWIFQNAVRYYAHGPAQRHVVRTKVLERVFGRATAERIEREHLGDAPLRELAEAPFAYKQGVAEHIAERIIAANYPAIMAFYAATLRDFFAAQRVDPASCAWLLEGMEQSRNALADQPETVDPAAVWSGPEFDIDLARGQVVRMRHLA